MNHLGIHNKGTTDELTIEEVVSVVGDFFTKQVEIVPGEPAKGSPQRRCPDVSTTHFNTGPNPLFVMAKRRRVGEKSTPVICLVPDTSANKPVPQPKSIVMASFF